MEITIDIAEVLQEARRVIAYTADKSPTLSSRYEEMLAREDDTELNTVHLNAACNTVSDNIGQLLQSYAVDNDDDGNISMTIYQPENIAFGAAADVIDSLLENALIESVVSSWMEIAAPSEAEKHKKRAEQACTEIVNLINRRERPAKTDVGYNDIFK